MIRHLQNVRSFKFLVLKLLRKPVFLHLASWHRWQTMSFSFTELTLKIKLQAGPLRKVTIPAFYTFGHLHKLLVFLFEWDDSHLHRFELKMPAEDEDDDLDPSDPLFLMINEMKKNRSVISNALNLINISCVSRKSNAKT